MLKSIEQSGVTSKPVPVVHLTLGLVIFKQLDPFALEHDGTVLLLPSISKHPP